MRILVFLHMSADTRIPPERDARTGRVLHEWQVAQVNPADGRALDRALEIKAGSPGAEIVLVHLGSEEAEPWLREALARGADRAVRIWDAQAAEAGAQGAAVILAAAASTLGFDLALTGTAGDTYAGGQMGVLIAEHLGVPCTTQALAVDIPIGASAGRVHALEIARVTRGLARGFHESVEVTLPAVVTVAAGESDAYGAAMDELLRAQQRDIPVWSLGELGVPWESVREADGALVWGRLRPPRPRLHQLVSPDPSLPAFERIEQLVRGTVRRREGTVVQGSAEEVTEAVFRSLLDEGWLDHLSGPDS